MSLVQLDRLCKQFLEKAAPSLSEAAELMRTLDKNNYAMTKQQIFLLAQKIPVSGRRSLMPLMAACE
jgi:hypothetical protein